MTETGRAVNQRKRKRAQEERGFTFTFECRIQDIKEEWEILCLHREHSLLFFSGPASSAPCAPDFVYR